MYDFGDKLKSSTSGPMPVTNRVSVHKDSMFRKQSVFKDNIAGLKQTNNLAAADLH